MDPLQNPGNDALVKGGARTQASRSDVCADDGSVQLNADAQRGENPSACGVRSRRSQKTGLKAQKTAEKDDKFWHSNWKTKNERLEWDGQLIC